MAVKYKGRDCKFKRKSWNLVFLIFYNLNMSFYLNLYQGWFFCFKTLFVSRRRRKTHTLYTKEILTKWNFIISIVSKGVEVEPTFVFRQKPCLNNFGICKCHLGKISSFKSSRVSTFSGDFKYISQVWGWPVPIPGVWKYTTS